MTRRYKSELSKHIRASTAARLVGFIVLIVVASTSVFFGQQRDVLLPVDEATQRPDFFSFRAALQSAIARHDSAALLAVVHTNIKNDFGGSDGIENFRMIWKISEPDSTVWRELGTALALGGRFDDN